MADPDFKNAPDIIQCELATTMLETLVKRFRELTEDKTNKSFNNFLNVWAEHTLVLMTDKEDQLAFIIMLIVEWKLGTAIVELKNKVEAALSKDPNAAH